jgi:hypothetical protein
MIGAMKYACIGLLAAALTYGVATLAGWRMPASNGVSSVAPASSESGQQAARDKTAPRRRASPGQLSEFAAALGAVQQASQSGSTDSELAAYRIPLLEPTPPLLALQQNTRSPDVRRAASEVRQWLRLTTDLAIAGCWRHRPKLPVWAEFSADLSAQEPETLGVSNLQLTRIHGDYALADREAACFKSRLATITARGESGAILPALRSELPLAEGFVVQWPCTACR